MINIADEIVQHPKRIKLTPVAGEADTYDYERIRGTVTADGTDVNRSMLMALQGFSANETVFNADGSITETNAEGEEKITVFNTDGSITETFTSGGVSIEKTTTFNADGSISEVIV